MAHSRLLAIFAAGMICAGCGGIIHPLDSPVPTSLPTYEPTGIPQATGTTGPATLTPTITTTPTPGPSPTPDTGATSRAVIATITALAATPTYPPTSTPHPRRTPIGAGPDAGDVPPTVALYSSGGITVQMLSQQVFPDGSASLTIQARPAAVCTLFIDRSTGSETRLEPVAGGATHTTGSDGVTAWIWTVDAKEQAGIMHLIVDCGAAGKASLQLKVSN